MNFNVVSDTEILNWKATQSERHTERTVDSDDFDLPFVSNENNVCVCVLKWAAERQISDSQTLIMWHFSLLVTRLWRDHLYLQIYNLNVRAIYGVDRIHDGEHHENMHTHLSESLVSIIDISRLNEWSPHYSRAFVTNIWIVCDLKYYRASKNCRRIRRHDVLLFNRTAIKLKIRSHSSWLGCI